MKIAHLVFVYSGKCVINGRAMYCHVWLCMSMYGYLRLCMAVYGYVGLCRVMYGYVEQCGAMYYSATNRHTIY